MLPKKPSCTQTGNIFFYSFIFSYTYFDRFVSCFACLLAVIFTDQIRWVNVFERKSKVYVESLAEKESEELIIEQQQQQ